MFKGKLGPQKQVHLADPRLFEQVMRAQGKYPDRPAFNSWKLYRRVTGKSCGIVTGTGEEWHSARAVLNKKMLPPKKVAEFTGVLSEVTSDLVEKLRYIRDTQGAEALTTSIPNELYKWSMESIGSVLFETRMGCLKPDMPERVQAFIDSISQMMQSSLQVMIGEEIHRTLNTRFWRRHEAAWDAIFDIGKSYIDEKLDDLEKAMEEGRDIAEEEGGKFLTHLLSSQNLSMRQIYANVTELLLSGVDTTSNTLAFTLHLLSTHPEVQEKLHAEVSRVLGQGTPTPESMEQMSYLKCILKEALRLYPVVTMNVRVLDEDLVIDGYRIPKKTMYVMNHYAACRNEQLFEKADEFIPERWDRSVHRHTKKPFASLPFGFGTRACLGKRIAKLELHLALSKMSQNFKLEPYAGMQLKPTLRTLLTAGPHLPLRMIDR
ncbi:hypothetical protein NP493_1092g00050 [Ridgeia piscesae]|uniref:Cholesterol side-chain cleavage enzyme, mitochondrial n=1 Tax=Ridgeia piscesae TaxID=27915 RepID=A0AAD9KH65_RIDPI|nr:hypothetical protein NP493_1092g00050 [Ridgeia piscesae]